MKKWLLALSLFFVTVSLIGCRPTIKDHLFIEDLDVLTALVYDQLEQGGTKETIDLDTFGPLFTFTDIVIEESFTFDCVFDVPIEPYFYDQIVGETSHIYVAQLSLYSSDYENWYLTEMIIIEHADQIFGFMAPTIGLTEGVTVESYPPYNGYYQFTSAIFISESGIVKYYTEEDIIYDFTVDVDVNNKATLEMSYGYASKRVRSTALYENLSVTLIEKSVYIDLINDTTIEESPFEMTLLEIDKASLTLRVESDTFTNLSSIQLSPLTPIYNQAGDVLVLDDLEVGDTLSSLYYERFDSYNPSIIYSHVLTVID